MNVLVSSAALASDPPFSCGGPGARFAWSTTGPVVPRIAKNGPFLDSTDSTARVYLQVRHRQVRLRKFFKKHPVSAMNVPVSSTALASDPSVSCGGPRARSAWSTTGPVVPRIAKNDSFLDSTDSAARVCLRVRYRQIRLGKSFCDTQNRAGVPPGTASAVMHVLTPRFGQDKTRWLFCLVVMRARDDPLENITQTPIFFFSDDQRFFLS